MTALEAATEMGHIMEPFGHVTGRDQWVCAVCSATLLTDERNKNGWGTALDRNCRSAA